MKVFSNILPKIKISGKSWVDVKASDNIQILKELSEDPFLFMNQISEVYTE